MRSTGQCFAVAVATVAMVAACWAQDAGKSDFAMSCAPCHGADGKGGGPVSTQLKSVPSDLTAIAKKNNGVFPVSSTYEVIDGRQAILAHGTRDMPIWGYRYRPSQATQLSSGADASSFDPDSIARARILAIIDYLNRIQEK
ncbi:c-type cytochrome [Bradyrhizobium sp. HKCCYLRH2015]|uniref:c-type cytochrome n=1 Tax=Bradyrhizobium TaxID=374 RepID=UPI003EBD8F62